MLRLAMVSVVLASLATIMLAQSGPTTQPAAPAEPESGFLSYIDFGGSSNTDGHLFTMGVSAGYQFNRHLSVSARLPVYFVSATGTTSSGTGTASTNSTFSNNGVGDPSLAVQLNFPNHVLNYQTRLTTWLPLASQSSGLGTGSTLVDWTNRVSRTFGRFTPFGQVDIANTVPDTPVFILPYTAQGMNTRFEGGANVELTKIFSVGASAYDVLPTGQQDIYSRAMGGDAGSALSGMSGATGGTVGGSTGGTTTATGGTMAERRIEASFMNPVTVGNGLTRDHGFATWLSASPSNYVDMQIAYARSYGYDLNTVSFGIGFNLGAALRHYRNE